MEKLVSILVIIGGIFGCITLLLVEHSFSWNKEGKVSLVKGAEKFEYLFGFFSVSTLFVALLLANI